MQLVKNLKVIAAFQSGSTLEFVTNKFQISETVAKKNQLLAKLQSPELKEFLDRIGDYSLERISRLYRSGTSVKELAFDYECTTSWMAIFLFINHLKGPSVIRLPVAAKRKKSRK